ncbi:hypothetical protein TSAR_008375 [Trichomalopsis sarcophagae]|uniref:Uncharacterized protein n=1 Tax=Trichomalopsis sarcophagae TaxID=543379 RepID=A0A232EFW9_9HYME|nr:hypothetical protein TSAR_008375 [Trichomalopsis sarcophagae]
MVKIALKKWRKGFQPKVYLQKKREWKKHCWKTEQAFKETEEAELRNIKRENDVWKYLNKSRKKRIKIENNIKENDWLQHFINLLEGSEEKCLGERRINEECMKEDEKISVEEIKRALKSLKKKKADGFDVWNGEGLPDDWKTGVIAPLFKKGDPELTKNYRGISLLSTAYKIYTEVLRGRLEKEVEEKGLIPEGQAGFRKGRSTIDNIFILSHIVQKAKKTKKTIY